MARIPPSNTLPSSSLLKNIKEIDIEINNFSCWIVCDKAEINCHAGLLLNEVRIQPAGLKYLLYFLCRPHSWQSSAPAWKEKKKRLDKNFNYRAHVDVRNKTLIQHLDSFTTVTAWTLPPFKLHNVMENIMNNNLFPFWNRIITKPIICDNNNQDTLMIGALN